MIEVNATSNDSILSALLRQLQASTSHKQQQPTQLSAANALDYDYGVLNSVAPTGIDLQEFIASASGGSSSSSSNGAQSVHSMLDYAVVSQSSSNADTVWLDLPKQLANFSKQLIEQLPHNNSVYNDSNVFDAASSETPCVDAYNMTWSNADQIETSRMEFWICGVLLNFLGLLGILGNIICMIILSRPQMRSSINYLLIGLARVDTALIITSILLFGIPSIYPYTGEFFFYHNNIYPFISPIVYPLALISQTASIYMTFTVTLERYVAVCHPLKARALCTYGRAKIYFIACVLFAIIYNLPRFWEAHTRSYTPPYRDDLILYCVRATSLRNNKAYMSLYIHWCYLIVNYIIPFLTLAILNCLIYRQVKRANRERARLSRSEKREIGLATMLLCVVIIFFIFNFLALVLNFLETYYDYIDPNMTKVSNLLVTVNSGANFLIYVIFGEKFKRIFLLIFFKRRLSRDQPDLIHYESSISNNGDGTMNRSSLRFSRHGTQRSTTTYLANNTNTASNTTLLAGSGAANNNSCHHVHSNNVRSISPNLVKIKRSRAPSPGPVVYYPARNLQRSTSAMETSAASITNNNTAQHCDWISMDVVSSTLKPTNHLTSGF